MNGWELRRLFDMVDQNIEENELRGLESTVPLRAKRPVMYIDLQCLSRGKWNKMS